MTTTNGDSVEVELRVGMLDFALAKLMSAEHHTIEFPTLLLPENVVAGSIIKLQCSRAAEAEIEDKEQFENVQQEILNLFATNLPEAPSLRARNITQTSAVLEWDPINVATADLHFMALYKGDQRIGFIPQPLKRSVTKISNLELDTPYKFRLVLSTSAGTFESNELEIRTHKMTNLTGIIVCLGSMAHSSISELDIRQTLERLGCQEPQTQVKLDTTHFICSTEGGAAYQRALELNIPIVRPEWLKACESGRRLASVREYYLSVDPPPVTKSPEPARPSSEVPSESPAEIPTENASEAPSQALSQPEAESEAPVKSEEPEQPKEHIESQGTENDVGSAQSVKSFDMSEQVSGNELSREVTNDPHAELKEGEEQRVVVEVPRVPEPHSAEVSVDHKEIEHTDMSIDDAFNDQFSDNEDAGPEPVNNETPEEKLDDVFNMNAVSEAINTEQIDVESEAAEIVVGEPTEKSTPTQKKKTKKNKKRK